MFTVRVRVRIFVSTIKPNLYPLIMQSESAQLNIKHSRAVYVINKTNYKKPLNHG